MQLSHLDREYAIQKVPVLAISPKVTLTGSQGYG